MQDWMRDISRKDGGKYSPEAFRFLVESLSEAIRLAGKDQAEGTERHVTGQELVQGMRAYAIKLFGPLAAQVWRSWGVHSTLDWGEMVFRMVEDEKLSRNEEDSIEDFSDGFDFDQVFVREYQLRLPDADDWTPQDI